MNKLIEWLRRRLFARRWESMKRKASMYQTDVGAWDYQPQELRDTRDSIIGAYWPK